MNSRDKFKFRVAEALVTEHGLSATDAMGLVSFYSIGVLTYGEEDVAGACEWVLQKLRRTRCSH